jgi:hypothetical protein
MATQNCTYFEKLKNESGAAMGTEVISGGGQRSRFFFRVPLTLTVAEELHNEHPALQVTRSFGSDRDLTLTA